jgi:hypothetical protein
MNKLTKEQSKMVIEFFAQQAAQEAPVMDLDWQNWDKHIWMTNYTAALAIERRIHEGDWAALVNAALDLQRFDRDPEAWLHERGELPSMNARYHYADVLQDVLSASIDTAFNTSKAA